MTTPKLSFIVLSYNYENYIGQTLNSIFKQTVGDFEIVVVDDCSTDGSRDVVRSFNDPRVRMIVNERNLGGAGSYNVAVSEARGEWLVNLDADDWIAPDKCGRQLTALAADPSIDIIGSWVKAVDAAGLRHPHADQIEEIVNRSLRFNLVETWIGQNPLCRSTTMVRRAAHLRFGLDDADMVRAPDYELWTRALARGARFALVEEPLTYMRQHARGVTHGDPVGTLLEMSFASLRNLAPLAERRAIFDAHAEIVRWIAKSDSLINLRPREALKLLGLVVTLEQFDNFSAFRAAVSAPSQDTRLERIGQYALTGAMSYTPPGTIEKLCSDIDAYMGARDYWKALHDQAAERLTSEVGTLAQERDFWKGKWQAATDGNAANLSSPGRLRRIRSILTQKLVSNLSRRATKRQ